MAMSLLNLCHSATEGAFVLWLMYTYFSSAARASSCLFLLISARSAAGASTGSAVVARKRASRSALAAFSSKAGSSIICGAWNLRLGLHGSSFTAPRPMLHTYQHTTIAETIGETSPNCQSFMVWSYRQQASQQHTADAS